MRSLILNCLGIFLVNSSFATQYVGVSVGTNDMVITNEDHSPKIGYKTDVCYGFKFENGMRSELAVSYAKNEFKTQYNLLSKDDVESKEYRTFHSWSYMANVLYDVSNLQIKEVTPYFGLGIGYCESTEKNKIKHDNVTEKDKFRDDRFAYQAIVGVKCPIDDQYSASLEYKFFAGRLHAKDHSVNLYLIRTF